MNRGQLQVELTIRGRVAEDVGFITAPWMRVATKLQPYHGIAWPVKEHHLHRHIERLWRDRDVVWLVGAYPQDVNFAYGYLCGEATDAGPVLHWCYVRRDMRKFGVATALMADFLRGQDTSKLFVTSETSHWRGFHQTSNVFRQDGKLLPYIYNPFLLWSREWSKSK